MNVHEKKTELLEIVATTDTTIRDIKMIGPNYQQIGFVIHKEAKFLGLTAQDVDHAFKWTFGTFATWCVRNKLEQLTGIVVELDPVIEPKSIQPEPKTIKRTPKKTPKKSVEEPEVEVDNSEHALAELMVDETANE